MKSLLAILLALVLCLSGVLVSCTPKDDGEPQVNANPEEDKKVISDKFSNGSLGEIFEQIETEQPDADLSSLYEEIAKIAFNAELSVETEWIEAALHLAMNDGILEAEISDNKSYLVIGDDFSLTTLQQFGNGYWVSCEQMMPSGTGTDISGGNIEDMLDLPEGVLDIVKDFSLPKIDVDDIDLKGDWYVLSDDCYEDIAKAVLDLIAEIAELQGEGPTKEEYDEALDQVKDAVDALGLEIGFAVVGANIVGVKVGVDADFEELSQIGGGMVSPYTVPGEENANNQKFEVEVEIRLTNDAMFLSSMKVDLDIDVEGVLADGTLEFTYEYENGMPSKMSAKVELEYAEGNDEPMVIDGEISYGLIFSEKEICGVDVDVDLTMENVEVGGDYYETNNGSYSEYVTCLGDVSIDASVLIDLSKIDEVGEKVVSVDVNGEVAGKSIFYYEDSEPYYNEMLDMWEHGESVKSTDMSIFVDAPKASDFNSAIDVNGTAKVVAENEIDVDFTASVSNEAPIGVTGTVKLEDTNVSLPSGIKADGLAEAYANISAVAEEIANNMGYEWISADGYYVRDAQSGLYAYISAYGYVEEIGTVLPTDEEFIDVYGTYIEYVG